MPRRAPFPHRDCVAPPFPSLGETIQETRARLMGRPSCGSPNSQRSARRPKALTATRRESVTLAYCRRGVLEVDVTTLLETLGALPALYMGATRPAEVAHTAHQGGATSEVIPETPGSRPSAGNVARNPIGGPLAGALRRVWKLTRRAFWPPQA